MLSQKDITNVSSIENSKDKNSNISDTYNFDKLQMYFGEPFQLTDKITIYQPTIGQILEFGELDFFNNLYIFIGNPTVFRLQLWKSGIDWNKISEYDLFSLLIQTCNKEFTQIIFGDIDFKKLKRVPVKSDNSENVVTLFDNQSNVEINLDTYNKMAAYLRTMFNIFPKTERAKDKTTKEWMIEEEQEKLQKSHYTSTLLPLVSGCINHPGFKYKLNELKEVGIVQFMDSVKRIQMYENSVALNYGLYAGMRDLSSVDKKFYNFMREISDS